MTEGISSTTPEPCPICQGTGTRGQMTGDRMAVVDCEPCEGTGRQPETTPTPDERTAFAQEIAEDIADEMMCPDAPPCGEDCTCWKEAVQQL